MLERIQRAKELVAKLEKKRAEAEAHNAISLESLQKEFGINSVEEGKERLKQLEAEILVEETELDTAMKELDEIMKAVSC